MIRKSKSPLNGIPFSIPRSATAILTASGDDDKGNGLPFFFPASFRKTASAPMSERIESVGVGPLRWFRCGGFVLPHGRDNGSRMTSPGES